MNVRTFVFHKIFVTSVSCRLSRRCPGQFDKQINKEMLNSPITLIGDYIWTSVHELVGKLHLFITYLPSYFQSLYKIFILWIST